MVLMLNNHEALIQILVLTLHPKEPRRIKVSLKCYLTIKSSQLKEQNKYRIQGRMVKRLISKLKQHKY
jgi:hypothetical protein